MVGRGAERRAADRHSVAGSAWIGWARPGVERKSPDWQDWLETEALGVARNALVKALETGP